MNDSNYRNHYMFNPNCICFRRRPSSVVSVVVVVLRPSSVPSVCRRRPSSSSSVRPSVVRRRPLPANPRPHAIFRKTYRIWVLQPRDWAHRIELDPAIFLAGRKLLYVLKKLVLQPKHFCFRILAPMSILTFWILYIMMIK